MKIFLLTVAILFSRSCDAQETDTVKILALLWNPSYDTALSNVKEKICYVVKYHNEKSLHEDLKYQDIVYLDERKNRLDAIVLKYIYYRK